LLCFSFVMEFLIEVVGQSFTFLLSAGMKGSRWELRHLTGSPGGGGVKGPVIL
jgi:hypothetical protein